MGRTVVLAVTGLFAMQVWAGPPLLRLAAVDALEKVFRDTPVPAMVEQRPVAVARGETASLQVMAWAPVAMRELTATCADFTRVDDDGAAAVLEPAAVRFVGYVYVDRATPRRASQPLGEAPGYFPDPLLEDEWVNAPAGAQPVYVTVPIPADAAAGVYTADVTVSGQVGGTARSATRAVQLEVMPVTVPPQTLWHTNWWRMTDRHLGIDVRPGTAGYEALMRRYARNMAAHRQNVAFISALNLVVVTRDADGRLRFDFGGFDRWVRVFQDEGVIGRIEGGHLGTRRGGWESQFGAFIWVEGEDGWERILVETDDPRVEPFYAQFLPALVEHLETRGWLEVYLQHIADEPMAYNLETYRQIAELVERYGPALRVIEATHSRELVDVIDVWVPQLHDWARAADFYRARAAAGDEVWFYTCLYPQGDWANRFIEQHLLKTRLLHWINFRHGATGYLHWGYNAWTAKDPFRYATRDHGGGTYLPAGDPWIVYPGRTGPLDSLRWEAVRDGIADYELLRALAEKDAAHAARLAERMVPGFDAYTIDVATFRAVRRELLTALSETDGE